MCVSVFAFFIYAYFLASLHELYVCVLRLCACACACANVSAHECDKYVQNQSHFHIALVSTTW